MTTPRALVRRLERNEVEGLGALFLKDASLTQHIDYWQDRGEQFLKIYAHHLRGTPVYWGLFLGNELLGVSGLIPTPVRNPYTEDWTYLDSDLYVVPKARGTLLVRKLVEMRFQDYFLRANEASPFIFGIEHIAENLQLCHRLAKKYGVHFEFPFSSELVEVFLTAKPEPRPSSVREWPLGELSTDFKNQWLKQHEEKNENVFLSPQLGPQVFSKILDLDPEARAFVLESSGELLAAALLVHTKRARRVVLSGQPSLLKARLERARATSLPRGSELKMGIVSLAVETKNRKTQVLREIFQKITNSAWDLGFHALSFRDEGDAVSGLSMDQLNFRRRVFIIYRDIFKGKLALERDVQEKNISIKLDGLFL